MAAKWTLITGASEGLGVEFARLAAAEGRDLILVTRQEAAMEDFAEALRKRHKIAVEVIACDMTDPAAVETLWRKVALRRHIEILVNNAGLCSAGPFATGDFRREMASVLVNVVALTILTKRAVPHMLQQGGGRILNVGAAAGFRPGPDMAVYHATKAYVLALGEAVAEELHGSPATITTLCPGAMEADFAMDAKTAGSAPIRTARPVSDQSIARKGWRAMHRGQAVKVTGLLNWLWCVAPHFLPRTVLRRSAPVAVK